MEVATTRKEIVMPVLQSILGLTGLALSLIASSCDASFRATPMSLEAEFHSRTSKEPESHHPPHCPETLVETLKLGNGDYLLLFDLDCDGIADLARHGTRQWLLRPEAPERMLDPSEWKPALPNDLPYLDPGFGDQSAEEWINKLGLDGTSPSQVIWLHQISTTAWTLDLTIPSTSQFTRPDFRNYDLGYQWDVLPGSDGPDFETWRVAGNLPDVLRFIVDCGIHSMESSTPAGHLVIQSMKDAEAVRVTLDGDEIHWIPLDD